MPSRQSKKAQPELVALFVSDIHLQPEMPLTANAFLQFLQVHAIKSPRLYLLGDLFEYWAGDDDLHDPFHEKITQALKQVSNTGTQIFWIAGNRDFLVGTAFAEAAGMTLLQEPVIEQLAGQKIVLLHGDAQCIDDKDYMAFRAQVRNPEWQQNFLGQPLTARKALIASMRAGSREAQRGKSYEIMDVNAAAIEQVFNETGADILIHGHTHRPASHRSENGKQVRHVLPDWDCDSPLVKGGWLGLDIDGHVHRYGLDGTIILEKN